jgi:K+-sensing histidine kinase KdpD
MKKQEKLQIAPREIPLDREDVSHPIRTPLTVMIGSLQSLNRQWEKLSEKKRRERLQMALDSVSDVLDAVNQVEIEISHTRATSGETAIVIVEES